MANAVTTKKESFRQLIDGVLKTDEVQFFRKNFLWLEKRRCSEESDKRERCLQDSRDFFVTWDHATKRMQQRAFYCMNECGNDTGCILGCQTDLSGKFAAMLDPKMTSMDEYLTKAKVAMDSN